MKQISNDSLDPMVVRVLDFVGKHGGPSNVARKVGIRPAVFYNYEAGRNKQPAPEILQKLATAYSDFDPTYILTGQSIVDVTLSSPAPAPAQLTNSSSAPQADQEKADLRLQLERALRDNESMIRENELLRDTVNILRNVVGSQLGKDLNPVKAESVNSATQGGQYILAFDSFKRVRPMINLDPRGARPINAAWMNQTQG